MVTSPSEGAALLTGTTTSLCARDRQTDRQTDRRSCRAYVVASMHESLVSLSTFYYKSVGLKSEKKKSVGKPKQRAKQEVETHHHLEGDRSPCWLVATLLASSGAGRRPTLLPETT
jgi:hypothetical protein